MVFPRQVQPANEEGQALSEYAWTLVLIALVVIVILAILGSAIESELWARAWNELRCIFTEECSTFLPAYVAAGRAILLL